MFVLFIFIGIFLILLSVFVIDKKKRSLRIMISLLGIAFLLSYGLLYFAISAPFSGGLFDFSYSVAGDYVLYRNSAEHIFVSLIDNWADENPVIPPKVIEIAWDPRFVLAKQVYLDSEKKKQNEQYADSLFREGVNFWILDTEIPRVYGPLIEREFESLKNSLMVHKSLVLNDVYSYR